jgi:hypothetical protein
METLLVFFPVACVCILRVWQIAAASSAVPLGAGTTALYASEHADFFPSEHAE